MSTEPDARDLRNRRIVTAALLLGLFLAALDVLVVAPAMPSVVADLGGLPFYPWVFSAYLLASTVTAPIYGRLADTYGSKRFYLLGLGLFLAGSASAGAAPTMGVLVGMRAVQGLGAGALISITLAIVGDLYPLRDRARVQGLFSSVWGIASVIGPPVGGALVQHLGWRSVFYLNVPFGLAAAWLVVGNLREPARDGHARHFDPVAAAALAAGMALVLLALQDLGRTAGALDRQTAGFAAAGVLLLAAFVWRERRAEEPFIDPLLFKRRLFLAANAGGFFGMAALYSASAYVPLLVRGVRDGSPQAAGLALAPLSLAWVVAAVIGGRMLLRTGYRVTTGLGTAFIAGGCLSLVTLPPAASDLRLYAALALMGTGMGLAMTGFIIAVQGAAPPGRMGIITSSVQFFRSLGGAVGVAVHGAVMLALLERRGVDPALLSPVGEASAAAGAAVSSEPLLAALHGVFVAGLLFALAAIPAGLAMPGGRPEAHAHASRR